MYLHEHMRTTHTNMQHVGELTAVIYMLVLVKLHLHCFAAVTQMSTHSTNTQP